MENTDAFKKVMPLTPIMGLLIDIHCHLLSDFFKANIDEAIKRANESGVKIILNNGINPGSNRETLKLAEKFSIVKAALGFHPMERMDGIEKEIDFIRKNREKISAIGEIGLDKTSETPFSEQKTAFEDFLQLGKEIKKPVIVHSRKAEEEVISILQSSGVRNAILHCFSGKKSLIKKAAGLGYCFSIPTSIARSAHFNMIVEMVDLSHLFCETDSPFLSPFRGKPNEPAFVIESYKKISEIKGLDLTETINNIWMNWQRVF